VPLILVVVVALLWLLVARHSCVVGMAEVSRRGALVVAFAMWQVLVVLITEGTSAIHRFSAAWVALAWCAVAAFLAFALRTDLAVVAASARRALRADNVWLKVSAPRSTHLAALAVLLGVLGVLAVVGWAYPPNNADSLVYHLARVAHWIQNRTVAPYATHYLAQVELSPLHEYNMAHLQLLSSTDRLDGYLQLFATVICVVGVSELARQLGLGPSGQLFAALLCATTPNVILEATSTQSDTFAAAIGVAAVVVVAPPWQMGSLLRDWLARGVAIGCVAGLSVLAKGTVIPLVWPTVVLLIAIAVRSAWSAIGARAVLPGLACAGVAAILAAALVAGPFLWRNVELFGGPSGPVTATTISVQLTPAAAVGNVIRSTASEFMIGDGKGDMSTAVSQAVLGGLHWAYDSLGLSPANPDYVLGTQTDAFERRNYYLLWDRNEGLGADPLQVVLMILTLVVLVVGVTRNRRELRLPFAAAITLCIGYVAFGGLSRWSVYVVRYYVPLFVLWCPLIAVAIGRLHRIVGLAVAVTVVVACLPQLLNNETRSLLHPRFPFRSRLDAYYSGFDPHTASVFAAANRSVAEAIARSSCRKVGIANWILFEYPLWPALHDAGWRGTLDDVDVTNESRKLEKSGFHPCALIREEDRPYVAPDPGMVAFRFFNLALSIDAASVNFASSVSPGVSSDSSNIFALPGAGWGFGAASAPLVLSGASELEVFARRAASVRIRLQLADSAATRDVSSPGASISTRANVVQLALSVPAGRSVVQIDSPRNRQLGVDAVTIEGS
jgi:hypothetical protein